MDRRLVVALIIITSLVAGLALRETFLRYHRANNPRAPRPQLVIFTYATFRDAFGPGPEIVKRFEEICLCDVKMVEAGAGRILLEKVSLGEGNQIDLVIGLDQLNLKPAAQKVKWRTIKTEGVEWDERVAKMRFPTFVPFDWSPLTFIYREGEIVPNDDLMKWSEGVPRASLALQDPALSSPGLQFLFWLYSVLSEGEFETFFKTLKPKIHSISGRWSDAYSVFQSGHAKATFTYLTSLVYHRENERDVSYKVAVFDRGHPMQIEYMAVPETCMSCGIAEEFVHFMLRPENQKLIMERNYMLPVVRHVADGTAYADLPKLPLMDFHRIEEFVDHQREIIKRWEQLVK